MTAREAFEAWTEKVNQARVYMGLPRLTARERIIFRAPFLGGVLAAQNNTIEQESVHSMMRQSVVDFADRLYG